MAFYTAVFETLIYSIYLIFLNFYSSNSGSFLENIGLINCAIIAFSVFISIFIARLMGASSFIEVLKSGKLREVSITMAVGCSTGLVVYYLLTVI